MPAYAHSEKATIARELLVALRAAESAFATAAGLLEHAIANDGHRIDQAVNVARLAAPAMRALRAVVRPTETAPAPTAPAATTDPPYVSNERALEIIEDQIRTALRLQREFTFCKDRRDKATSSARFLCIYLARELTALSLTELARHYHYKDHTTIMLGARKVEKAQRTSPSTAALIEDLLAACRARFTTRSPLLPSALFSLK